MVSKRLIDKYKLDQEEIDLMKEDVRKAKSYEYIHYERKK